MTENWGPDGLPGGYDGATGSPTPPRASRAKIAGIAAAAVVAFGGGVWGAVSVFGSDAGAPGTSPSPTFAGPSPSASSSVTLGPEIVGENLGLATEAPSDLQLTILALPGEVTVDPSLPDAQPLPDDIWGETADGWTLATYAPSVWRGDRATGEQTVEQSVQVVYLVAPDGTRYQVLEIDPEQTVFIDSWTPGESRAYVQVYESDWQVAWGSGDFIIDLSTGELSDLLLPFDYTGAKVDLTFPEGVRIWNTWNGEGNSFHAGDSYVERPSGFWLIESLDPPDTCWRTDSWAVSPGGDWVALNEHCVYGTGALELATGRIVPVLPSAEENACGNRGWADETHLMYYCPATTVAGGIAYRTLDVTTGVSVESDPATVFDWDHPPFFYPAAQLEPGVVLGQYYDGTRDDFDQPTPTSLMIDDHGSRSVIELLDEEGNPQLSRPLNCVAAGRIFIDENRNGYSVLSSYDIATWTGELLIPIPPGGVTEGVTQVWLDGADEGIETNPTGATSWVVGGCARTWYGRTTPF